MQDLLKIEKKKRQRQDIKEFSIILILIGGNHGAYKLDKSIIKKIINKVLLNLEMKDSVLISTSRRTSLDAIKFIDRNFNDNSKIKKIYHPNFSSENNPIVNAMLKCKEIIVTGDSMSMVSESCSINKPVRIYFDKKICSPKQIDFCKKLIKQGYAFDFNYVGKRKNNIKVLETSKNISNKINEVFLKTYGKN